MGLTLRNEMLMGVAPRKHLTWEPYMHYHNVKVNVIDQAEPYLPEKFRLRLASNEQLPGENRCHGHIQCHGNIGAEKLRHAVGITRGLLNQWVQRGLIRPEVEAPSQGAGAVWSLKSICLAGIMKELVDTGWTKTRAGWVVSSDQMSVCVDSLQTGNHKSRRILIVTRGQELEIRWCPFQGTYEMLNSTTARFDTHTFINLDHIMERIDRNLG